MCGTQVYCNACHTCTTIISCEMYKNKNTTCKACETAAFFFVKYANLWHSCRRGLRGYLSSPIAFPRSFISVSSSGSQMGQFFWRKKKKGFSLHALHSGFSFNRKLFHPSWILTRQWCWFSVRKERTLFKPLQKIRTIKCSLEWRYRFCRCRHCVSCLLPFCRRVNVHLSDGSLGFSYKAVVYCGQVRKRTRW